MLDFIPCRLPPDQSRGHKEALPLFVCTLINRCAEYIPNDHHKVLRSAFSELINCDRPRKQLRYFDPAVSCRESTSFFKKGYFPIRLVTQRQLPPRPYLSKSLMRSAFAAFFADETLHHQS